MGVEDDLVHVGVVGLSHEALEVPVLYFINQNQNLAFQNRNFYFRPNKLFVEVYLRNNLAIHRFQLALPAAE